MKHFYFTILDIARAKEPADFEWFDCMMEFKKKFPKTSIHKRVFKKWLEEWKELRWEESMRILKAARNYNLKTGEVDYSIKKLVF